MRIRDNSYLNDLQLPAVRIALPSTIDVYRIPDPFLAVSCSDHCFYECCIGIAFHGVVDSSTVVTCILRHHHTPKILVFSLHVERGLGARHAGHIDKCRLGVATALNVGVSATTRAWQGRLQLRF